MDMQEHVKLAADSVVIPVGFWASAGVFLETVVNPILSTAVLLGSLGWVIYRAATHYLDRKNDRK